MKLPTPPELIAAAKRGLDIPAADKGSDAKLDRALYAEYQAGPGQSLISRWRRGLAGPKFEYAIVLLDAAGWLNEVAIRKAREATSDAPPDPVLKAAKDAAQLLPPDVRPRDRRNPESETG